MMNLSSSVKMLFTHMPQMKPSVAITIFRFTGIRSMMIPIIRFSSISREMMYSRDCMELICFLGMRIRISFLPIHSLWKQIKEPLTRMTVLLPIQILMHITHLRIVLSSNLVRFSVIWIITLVPILISESVEIKNWN